jgi:hypothetical protein
MSDLSNNPSAVIAICIAIAGFVVCAGLGISRMLGDSDTSFKEHTDGQRIYMAEVRRQYVERLKYEV